MPARNPLTSARQYGLAQAVASGTVRGKTSMTPKVARELISKTPKAKRAKFARQLGREENPSKMIQRLKRMAGHGSSTWITYASEATEAKARSVEGRLEAAGVRHVKVSKQGGGLFGPKDRVNYDVLVLREGVRAMERRASEKAAETKKPKSERTQAISFKGETIKGNKADGYRAMGESFPTVDDAKLYIAASKGTATRRNPMKPKGTGKDGYYVAIGVRKTHHDTFTKAWEHGVKQQNSSVHDSFSVVDAGSGHGVRYTRKGEVTNPRKGPLTKSRDVISGALAPLWIPIAYLDKGLAKVMNGKRRKNPAGDSAAMYESFHGLPSTEVVEVKETEHFHEHLAALGVCCGIIIEPVTGGDKAAIGLSGYVWDARDKGFVEKNHSKGDMVLLSSSEDGRQLFLVGAPVDIDLKALAITGKAAEKELIDLGSAIQIWYETTKQWSIQEKETAQYHHKFSEETKGPRPEVIYSRLNKRLMFAGGSYYVPRPLIGTSPGITD